MVRRRQAIFQRPRRRRSDRSVREHLQYGIKSLFTEDAEIWRQEHGFRETEPILETVDEFVDGLQSRHDADHAVSTHHGHMPEIEILDESHACAIWSMFDWVDRPKGRAFQGFGHYFEVYEKGADGKWRIKSWRLSRLRVDQMPSTLESAPNYGFVPGFWPE